MEPIVIAAAGLVTLTAAAGALARIVVWARRMFRMVDAIETVVSRELEHNHGGSMKDDTYGTALAFGALSRLVDDIDERLTEHLDGLDGRNRA